jgi:hypothetical protein
VEAVADQLSHDSTQILSPIVADGEAASTCDTAAVARQARSPTGKRLSRLRAESGHRKKPRGRETLPRVSVIGTYLTEEERNVKISDTRSPNTPFLPLLYNTQSRI